MKVVMIWDSVLNVFEVRSAKTGKFLKFVERPTLAF